VRLLSETLFIFAVYFFKLLFLLVKTTTFNHDLGNFQEMTSQPLLTFFFPARFVIWNSLTHRKGGQVYFIFNIKQEQQYI
jgi:hypothetical protein